MNFRVVKAFGEDAEWKEDKSWGKLPPAADGQLGTIVRVYRDWKISGNDEFLKKLWNKISKSLDFAFEYWDTDGDFVLDSEQHTTYDHEFYGPNSLTNSLFFAALQAGACMAEYINDTEHARKYREAFQKGRKKMDDLLWNGERAFALNDEKGLLVCSWPKGGRPKLPFRQCDEVWTGIEYQVAAHLIYEGFVEEGLTIVRAVRKRYDGYRRN